MPKALTYDVLLSFRVFAKRAAAIRTEMVVLAERLGATRILSVDGYYSDQNDTAVFLVHCDPRVISGTTLRLLGQRTRGAGGDMLDLCELAAEERERLHEQILPRYPVARVTLPGLLEALDVVIPEATGGLSADDRSGAPPVVRFRRGQDWQPGRLCRLGDDGLFIATGGPPREGDSAEIELLSPLGSLLVGVSITQVTLPCWAESLGTTGFAARFTDHEVLRRPQSRKILAWARSAIDRAAPPPRRRETRFPLRWPAYLLWKDRDEPVTIRDVSHRGIFLETAERPDPREDVQLRIPVDQRDVPLRISGRIARIVDSAMADALCCPPGLGITISDADSADLERFMGFVSRVANRSDRHIVIGGSGERLDSLVTQFAAIGYLTTGLSNARDLYKKVTEAGVPPELILLDSSLEERSAEILKHKLGKRHMPLLDVDSAPADARRLVDAALIGG